MPADRRAEDTLPLRHAGPCGRRIHCYRPECRRAFGPYRTVEIVDRTIIYFCHGLRVPADSIDLGMLGATA